MAYGAEAKTPLSARPNIIYILADDLGYGDLGCFGQQRIKTPCLDRMAREGIRMTQHYCGSAVSAPSRATLLSGQHTGHVLIRSLPAFAVGGPVDFTDQDILISQELQKAGYKTAMIGKWGLAEAGMASMPLQRGFDYFFGYKTHIEAHHYYLSYLWRNDAQAPMPDNDEQNCTGVYSHDMFTAETVQFISKNHANPFFLYLAYTIPHYELTVPEDSKVPYLNLGWEERPMKAGHYRHDPEGNTTYAGMVSRMDRDIGKLLDLLRELGIAENTLVIFSSDNGPEYDRGFFRSNGGFRGQKRDLYEGGLRTPFIAWWPGKIKGGTTSEHVAAFWDFFPTACEAADIKSKATIDGISYLSALTGKGTQKQHEYLYWELNEKRGPAQAIRYGDWKMVKLFGKPMEIYNLRTDIGEGNNIAGQHPEIVRTMESFLAKCRTDNPYFPIDRIVSRMGNTD